MQRIYSVEIASRIGERVKLAGWLQSVRRMGRLTFITLRDGRGLVQAVMGEPPTVQPESVIELEGTVVAEPQAPGGSELHQVSLRVVSEVTEPLPVPLSKRLAAQLPTLLEHAMVVNRHPVRRAIFRLGAAAMRGFRRALEERGFVEIQSPKLVESATEGGANVFALEYFGRRAYLAQSPQFYKQAMVGVFERVFEVGPVFRAEPHHTARHLNQYTSLDVELGFIESHREVMALLIEVLRAMLHELERAAAPELQLLGVRLPSVPEQVPAIHFTEAQERIAVALGAHERGEPDLSPEGERWLGAWALEQHHSELLFVTGYPMRKRPFSPIQSQADPSTRTRSTSCSAVPSW
jgi:nondiscriminating aspartyl-tRNA synthetase